MMKKPDSALPLTNIAHVAAPKTARRNAWIADLFTVVLAFLWLSPLLFGVLLSVRSPEAPVSAILFSPTFTGQNYSMAWSLAPWPLYYLNTVIFVAGTLLVQLITVTLAAYAFARMHFWGRDILLIVILLQIMIPAGVLIAQNFATVFALGAFNTHVALMLPYWGSAFGVLMLRGAFRAVPLELEEAARMDGANVLHLLRHIYMPLAVPTYVAFALVSISAHWNEYLWPLIVTNTDSIRPLTVGLNKLVQSTEVGALYNQMMAGTVLVIAPLVVLFMIFQRRFVESFAQSGVK